MFIAELFLNVLRFVLIFLRFLWRTFGWILIVGIIVAIMAYAYQLAIH